MHVYYGPLLWTVESPVSFYLFIYLFIIINGSIYLLDLYMAM
jgi:hypothetical protein